jgi:hypothetical protein
MNVVMSKVAGAIGKVTVTFTAICGTWSAGIEVGVGAAEVGVGALDVGASDVGVGEAGGWQRVRDHPCKLPPVLDGGVPLFSMMRFQFPLDGTLLNQVKASTGFHVPPLAVHLADVAESAKEREKDLSE